jgi:hypothetical protein
MKSNCGCSWMYCCRKNVFSRSYVYTFQTLQCRIFSAADNQTSDCVEAKVICSKHILHLCGMLRFLHEGVQVNNFTGFDFENV